MLNPNPSPQGKSTKISVVSDGTYQLLVLPSENVFVVPLSAESAKLADQQLRYELEADLLIEAESMVCDVHARAAKLVGSKLGEPELSGSRFLEAIALVADGAAVASQFDEVELDCGWHHSFHPSTSEQTLDLGLVRLFGMRKPFYRPDSISDQN